MKKNLVIMLSILLGIPAAFGQPIPADEEDIPFLVTFGKNADKSWGDDDFCQIHFLVIPQDQMMPFYIRVFDPDIGGKHDEVKTGFNTRTSFEIYGGPGAISDEDARKEQPVGNYKSGILMDEMTFGADAQWDNNWYSFGPYNPVEGELDDEYGGYVFKIICEGVSGDDGNAYRYFFSTSPSENLPIEGANSLNFEFTFRLHAHATISHIYPFVGKDVTAVNNRLIFTNCFL